MTSAASNRASPSPAAFDVSLQMTLDFPTTPQEVRNHWKEMGCSRELGDDEVATILAQRQGVDEDVIAQASKKKLNQIGEAFVAESRNPTPQVEKAHLAERQETHLQLFRIYRDLGKAETSAAQREQLIRRQVELEKALKNPTQVQQEIINRRMTQGCTTLRKYLFRSFENRQCASCGESAWKVKLLVCGGCKQVWYCSPEHQKAHWKEGHKVSCKTKTAGASTDQKADSKSTTTTESLSSSSSGALKA